MAIPVLNGATETTENETVDVTAQRHARPNVSRTRSEATNVRPDLFGQLSGVSYSPAAATLTSYDTRSQAQMRSDEVALNTLNDVAGTPEVASANRTSYAGTTVWADRGVA